VRSGAHVDPLTRHSPALRSTGRISYEEGEIAKTTHNVCTRQLKDDANRLKCRKNQQEKERKYLFMIGKAMKDVGDSEG